MDMWDKALEEYDEVVHIPMSAGLSSSCETAIMLSQDYDGKVQVVNNHRISVTQRRSVEEAKKLADAGKSATEIKKLLEAIQWDSDIYAFHRYTTHSAYLKHTQVSQYQWQFYG